MTDREASSRARLIFAGGLFLGLSAAVLLVVALGGEGDDAAAADARCLQRWNDDPTALALGVHQVTAHRYGQVQVLRLSADDGSFAESDDGECAIVFAAAALDPEPASAAQVYERRRWRALDSFTSVTTQRLGELQSEAVAEANAVLGEDGRLSPLS